MKPLLNNLLFGKNAKASGVFALALVALVALGCTCGKNFDLGNLTGDSDNTRTNDTPSEIITPADDSAPSNDVVEGLVKETIAEFADAVNSGDFTELHDSASQDFQSSYTVDEMRTAFKSYIDKKSVVLPILRRVAKTDGKFTNEPSVRKEKGLSILMAEGEFPTKPYKVRFDYEYVMRDGEWKLLKLVINIP
jgi:hypothetical protein